VGAAADQAGDAGVQGSPSGLAEPVLVLNAGSSSLKFALVDPASGARPFFGLAERIGTSQARLVIDRVGHDRAERAMPGARHGDVVAAVLDDLERTSGPSLHLLGVGHRVVHGGELFADSTVIDEDVVKAIAEFSRLAPLHNPAALLGIDAARAALPGVPQVAVFDTAFHQSMPSRAFRYAVPEEWYTRFGVRRYGFHGTSHRYVSQRAAQVLGRPIAELALVVAHLGNGCSATAVLAGASLDTTMGLTPLEGLVMGTRSGDIDPGIFGFLAHEADLTVDAITGVLNGQSGLLGLSGTSNDMRTVVGAAERGDERASLALDVFVYRLAKSVAALVVPLGRLDALVFTGGIGENSAVVRAGVLDALGFLGLTLDVGANAEHGRSTQGRVSVPAATVALVVATDEEFLIAQDTARLAGAGARQV
jgi:acetate kinase